MKRGDIVTIADRTGDYSSKPRPAVIVQSNIFNESHDSFTVCLITGALSRHGLFRIPLSADLATGLRAPSEIAVDKVQSVRRIRIGRRMGAVSDDVMILVDEALRRWLAL